MVQEVVHLMGSWLVLKELLRMAEGQDDVEEEQVQVESVGLVVLQQMFFEKEGEVEVHPV